ncbi:MAG: hypothetical protein ACOC7R_01070 [Planctomycetota bacterium]
MLLKWIRKFLKFVRGGARPWQVALSCLIGVAIGMVPSFNLTVVGLIVLFVLLNLNLALGLLGLAVGKALCLALAPVTYPLGHWVIHDMGLTGLFRAATAAPVLAWMGLDTYCLIGGVPVALIVGGGGGLLLGHMVLLTRKAVAAGGARSERVTRLGANPVVKLLMRVLFGKQKMSLAEMLTATPPVFRKGGLIACGAVVVLLLGGPWLLADTIAAAGLTRGLEASTGAEVNVAGVDVSLLRGHLTVRDLRMTDPDKPTHDMARIDRLTGDLSVRSLLARRIVLDEVVIGQLRSDVRREKAGEVFKKPDEPEPPVTENTLSAYFADGEKILEYLRKARRYLERRRRAHQQRRRDEPPTPEEIRRQAMLDGYLRLSARDLITPAPAVTIRRLVIEAIPADVFGPLRVEGLHVSSHPELTGDPMRLSLTGAEGLEGSVTLSFADTDTPHALRLAAPNVPVGEGSPVQLDPDKPLRVRRARVSVTADGTFTDERVDLPVALAVRDFQGGADSEIAAAVQRVLSTPGASEVTVHIAGPLAAPRITRIEAPQLRSAIDDAVKGTVKDTATNLLRGLKGDADERKGEQEQEKDDPARRATEALRGLLP